MTAKGLFLSIEATREEIENAITLTEMQTGLNGIRYDGTHTSKTNRISDVVFDAATANISKEECVTKLWAEYNHLLHIRTQVLDEIEKRSDDGILYACLLRLVCLGKTEKVICKELEIEMTKYKTLLDCAMQEADYILSGY